MVLAKSLNLYVRLEWGHVTLDTHSELSAMIEFFIV